MGKKSLIKSTSKKKPAPKKATSSRRNPKKKAPAKKAAAKAKPAARTAKKAAAKAKPISVKDLLMKKFDVVAPKQLYTVPKDKAESPNFSAPELLAGYGAEDSKRIKGLLANTYSEKELKAVAKVPVPKAKPISKEELLKKQFDVVVPKQLYSVPADKTETPTFSAPELLTGYGAEDAKRIKGLMTNTYNEKELKAAAEKAAAEKAAAEKAAAEKAAAEKAAAEKAAAEKAAAEKAAAEKAAAEKAAAEKAAAEKAAAEKAAAEKAAAEKAAAEKAAAEKAAAEKAAAEKAAAEKAAAEKAAAEKAAAEKAEAIRKAAEQKSDVKVSYQSAPAETSPKEPADPVDKTIKILAAALAFLVLLVVGASMSNSSKYYLTDNKGALEVWQGKFAPLGKKQVISLAGVPVPEKMKAVYRSGDVFPLIFQYYIDQADGMLKVDGTPDFDTIKKTLKTSLEYGSTSDLRDLAYARLDNIDRLVLTYKAQVAASRGTIEDLTAAIGFLEEISNLTDDDSQKEIIAQKIADHKVLIQELEEKAAAEKAAAEKAAAEKAAAEKAAEEKAAAEAAEAEAAAAAEEAQADSEVDADAEEGAAVDDENAETQTEDAAAEHQ